MPCLLVLCRIGRSRAVTLRARFARVGVYDRLPPSFDVQAAADALLLREIVRLAEDPAYLGARMWFAWLSYPAAISSTAGRSSSDTVMLFACAGAHGSATGRFISAFDQAVGVVVQEALPRRAALFRCGLASAPESLFSFAAQGRVQGRELMK